MTLPHYQQRLFQVDPESDGTRLDRWLAEQIPGLSRTKLQGIIQDGGVLINAKPARSKDLLSEDDQVEIRLEVELFRDPHAHLEPVAMDLDILYEDDDLIVLNKPAGLIVHPGAGDTGATLVHGLLAHCKDSLSSGGAKHRPGIVHRLDKDTSGVLVCAKNEVAHLGLSKQFAEKSNLRRYRAILDGAMREKERVVETHLYRDPKNRLKFASKPTDELLETYGPELYGLPKGFRWAKSTFFREKLYGNRFSEVMVELHTGRTHQIRVHSSVIGLPVLGDPLYNKKKVISQHFSSALRQKVVQLDRQMLHAEVLGFTHPRTGQDMTFTAPIPKDFEDVLNLLTPYLE